MADFRKLLFVLIAGALLFTTVASAETFHCTATPVQTLVRQEGLADYVGDIIISDCLGTVDTPSVGIRDVNIRLTIDTPGVNITSNLLTSSGLVTEATMILNGGLTAVPGRQYIGYSSLTPLTAQTDGSQNIYQAVQVANNAVEWQGVVVAGPNSNPFTIMRLTNVRVNAASLPAGTAIIARVNITSSTSFPILNSASLTVANVIKAMTFSTSNRTFDTCVLPVEASIGDFDLIFTENYGPAFRVIGAAATDNNIPGGNYPNESGFNPTPLTGSLIAPTLIGQADNPTELQATIEHIPAGVSSLTATYTVSTGSVVTGDIALNILPITITGTVPNRTATITALVTGVTGTALYLPNVVDIKVAMVLDGTVTAPRGNITAKGTLAPVSTVGVMSFLAPEPRFMDGGTTGLSVFTFNGICHSLLLFPYITNQAGFDTGLVISNTSVDPLGTPAQNGACTLNYYGFVGANAALSAAQSVATSPDVPAGAQLIMLLSAGGGSVNPMGAGAAVACANCAPVGFQGYMIASCNFQFAHGYAFISDLGASKLAQGYLALVIPERASGASTIRLPQFAGVGAVGNQGEQLGQ